MGVWVCEAIQLVHFDSWLVCQLNFVQLMRCRLLYLAKGTAAEKVTKDRQTSAMSYILAI